MAERPPRKRRGDQEPTPVDLEQVRKTLANDEPPQDLLAEKAVLGAILRKPDCIYDVVRLVSTDSFAAPRHRCLFQAMIDLLDAGTAITPITLGEKLFQKGELKLAGGADYIQEIWDDTLTAATVVHHAQIVHDKAVVRRLIDASGEILFDSFAGRAPAAELVASAEKKIFKILEDGAKQEVQSLRSVMVKAFERISSRKENQGNAGGVPTGFTDMDGMTNGWQESELIILAARPSMGKTALAMNFVESAAIEHKKHTLFISLEMSELELAERLLAMRTDINGHALRKGAIGKEEWQELLYASDELSQCPLYIDDTPGQTMLQIAATARRLKLKEDLRLIVIDYLQLIEPDDKSVSRVEQIGTISRRLKNLAREMKVPVIALSQLNRGAEQREGHRPRMSDLRESGSIEQDADVVLLLHRDDAYDPDKNKGHALVIIAKQRNGPTGDVKLTFVRETTRFRNFIEDYVPDAAAPADNSEY